MNLSFTQPSYFLLFYSEINYLISANELLFVKIKLENNIYIKHKKTILHIYPKLLTEKKVKNLKYILNFLLFSLKNNYFGTNSRFRISGRGYRLFSEMNHILFKLGYSHVINFTLPIQYEIQKKEKYQSFFKITSIGTQNIGNFLYKIKTLRMPNVYSKKGIFRINELVHFKEGKKNFTL